SSSRWTAAQRELGPPGPKPGVRLSAYARHSHCEVTTFDQGLIKKFPEIAAAEPTKPKVK
ncbi:MAG: hypothetical protein JWQ62_2896, partial [Lacunisphaera sp.]|nr:hypothetical protein [Lacunisphaera sp.]